MRIPLIGATGACRAAVTALLTAGAALAAIGSLGVLVVAYAGELGLKPGLWEVRLVQQVVDGQDVSQQLTESIAKGQTALSHLPPETRAQVQKMLNDQRVSSDSNASFRICISPRMAASDLPVLDKDNSCRPTLLSRSGNQITFRIDCSTNGTHIQGLGNAVRAGDIITTSTDVTTHAADGSQHSIRNRTQMQYVGARCEEPTAPH